MSTRILVVDDQPGVTRACVKILSRAGYEVVEQNHSLAALQLLKEEPFDLLLTDIRMPEMDGMELLTAAKQVDPHLSVVVITGYGTMDDAVKAIRLGAQGFLLKPYDPDELVAVINENLQRRKLIRDSVRLQTLLPLLKLSDALQEDKGAQTITEQALQVAAKEIDSGRLQLWLKETDGPLNLLTSIDYIPDVPAQFSSADLERVLDQDKILLKYKNGQLTWEKPGSRQAMAVCLPLISKGEKLGILVAELPPYALPLSNFQLELLQVLSRQLAGAIENINLFNRAETLRAFNQNIIENITTGLVALDHQGNITVLNKAASALLGLQSKDLLGQSITIALAHISQLADILVEPLKGGPSIIHRDLTLEHWDKGQLTVSVTASALYDASDQISGVVGLIDDLTELKALEAERRRLDRLAALGEMSAVVAHELRNPIAGIAAGIEYLTKKIDLNSAEYQGSRMILKEINRVHRIVEDILLVARPLDLQKSSVSLRAIIENICQRHGSALTESKLQVNILLEETLAEIVVDGDRIEQVFDNLMSNALHAMPDGGTITISATQSADQKEMIILFEDTGPGILTVEQQKIFEPFFTTKSRGVGLGLALSRRILEAHGGSISITETSDAGTTFEIRLPLQDEKSHGAL